MPLTFGTKLIAFFPLPWTTFQIVSDFFFLSLFFCGFMRWRRENGHLPVFDYTASIWFSSLPRRHSLSQQLIWLKWSSGSQRRVTHSHCVCKAGAKSVTFFYFRKLFHYITVYRNSSTASSPALCLGTTTSSCRAENSSALRSFVLFFCCDSSLLNYLKCVHLFIRSCISGNARAQWDRRRSWMNVKKSATELSLFFFRFFLLSPTFLTTYCGQKTPQKI